jgi:hypothetical protein
MNYRNSPSIKILWLFAEGYSFVSHETFFCTFKSHTVTLKTVLQIIRIQLSLITAKFRHPGLVDSNGLEYFRKIVDTQVEAKFYKQRKLPSTDVTFNPGPLLIKNSKPTKS